MAQLLSAFWIQANLPDNLPSNIEAISDSFILTLIVLRMKVVLFFLVHIDITYKLYPTSFIFTAFVLFYR